MIYIGQKLDKRYCMKVFCFVSHMLMLIVVINKCFFFLKLPLEKKLLNGSYISSVHLFGDLIGLAPQNR